MAAWRRAIELALGEEDTAKLRSIAQSRTEPASRVERARILLAYREDPSFFAVGRALGLHHQTVQRCVERAVAEGPMAALDDRPRPGREPSITFEAKAWLVSLACRKAKDLGYPSGILPDGQCFRPPSGIDWMRSDASRMYKSAHN
jgi:winged helix-turn helix protein